MRTPYKLSLAEVSPSALELFENGISFDHFNHSKTHEGCNSSGQSVWHPNSQEAISPTSQAADWTASPATDKNPTSDKTSPTSEYFLDRGAPAKVDPGGGSGSLAETMSPKTGNSWAKRLPRNKSFRLLFKKGSSSVLPFTKTNGGLVSPPEDSHQVEHDPAQENQMPYEEVLPAAETTHESPHCRGKRSKMFLRTLSSMTNLHSNQTVPPVQETTPPCKAQRHTSERILQDMTKLRQKLGDLDRTGIEVRRGHADLCDADHEWIEDTIRDITRKGMEAAGGSVCTPTTTTTGYGQQESLLLRKDGNGPQSDLRVQEAEGRDELTCYRPARRLSGSNKRHSPEKRHQNISASELDTTHHTGIDVTSTSHLATTKQRIESLVTESVAPARRTKRLQEGIQVSKQRMELQQDRKGRMTEQEPHEPSREGSAYGHLRVYAMQKPPMVTVKVNQGPVPKGLVPIPGSYPAHSENDGAGGTEDHSDEFGVSTPASLDRAIRRQEEDGWPETEDVVYGLYKYGIFLLKLYWKIVGPVFDPHSVYWQRQAQQEATVLDSVVLVLALPGVILATAAVAWGMGIAAVTGVYIRDAVGSLGGDMLYL